MPNTATHPQHLTALLQRRQQRLGAAYRLFYDDPLHPVSARGVWITASDGKQYLDVYNNVPCVGHCHPHVVAALAQQAATLNTHTRYVDTTILDYADRLVATFPPELSQVMFTCSGSEANDLAMRVARSFTGGTGFIVTQHAYHGVTLAVSELSPSLGKAVPLGKQVRTIDVSVVEGLDSAAASAALTQQVNDAIASLQAEGILIAGFIADTIFSSDGVYPSPAGFLAGAVDAVRQAGGLFIADEVQPGFGRTGSHMWGFQRHNLVPDLVTLGKPMGNGHPIAAMVAKPELLDHFGALSRYFNTFGGNPVSCAVGAAVLDVIEQENLQQNAAHTGHYLQQGLLNMARTYPTLGAIRGAGLFLGVDIVHQETPAPQLAWDIVNGLRQRGVLINVAGPQASSLKIRPPLVFTSADADIFLEKLDQTLQSLTP